MGFGFKKKSPSDSGGHLTPDAVGLQQPTLEPQPQTGATLGRRVSRVYALGYFGALLRASLSFWRNRNTSNRVLIMQIFFTGFEALGTIALISIGIGAVIILQGIALLPQFGAQDLMYTLLVLVITRELGPLLTAFIIAARSGSAITTELGNMVVSHEVEAYVATGISPIAHLGAPRFLAVISSMLTLNIYFNICGLLGSFLIVQIFQPLRLDDYLGNLLAVVRPWDLFAPFLKSLSFGMIIGAVATYYGFQVERAVTEVPQKTIKSIASSILFCIIANIVVVVLTYTLGG